MRTDLPRHPALAAAAGGAVAAIGLLMMAAWLFRIEGIVRLFPGFLMVFNTALGFAVTGAALAAGALAPGSKRRVQTAAGIALGALGLVVLAQHVFDLSPGIDWTGLHAWLAELDGRPHPGRMSPATAATFMITGAVLVLGTRVQTSAQALLVPALAASVSVIGVMAIAGYLLHFPEVFDAYWLHQVALPTAITFAILGGALWLNSRDEPWNRLRPLRTADQRIALAGAAVLALAISATGIAVFSMMQASLERNLTGDLALALQTRGMVVGGAIGRAIQETADVAERPNIRRLYFAPSRNPADPNHPAFLPKIAASLLQSGFSAFGFYDAEGRELARSGEFPEVPELRLPVTAGARQAELLWDGKHALLVRVDVVEGGRRLGEVRGLHRLPELDDALAGEAEPGKSREFVLCGSIPGGLRCAPTRLQPRPFDVAIPAGKRLPMNLALDGDTGVIKLTDYRHKGVLAAYAPLGATGLGTVLKIDLAELYAPIRGRFGYFVLTLLVGSAAGGWLLHRNVRPLVRSLARREEQLRLALESSQLAIWDWDLAAGSIHLGEQWSAILGGTPRAIDISPEEWLAVVHPDDVAAVREQVRTMLNGTLSHYDIEHRVRTDSGEWKWIRSRGRVVERSARGTAIRATGTNVDIDERKNRELLVTRLAHHDVLTGLPNRSLFRDRLDQALLRSRRGKTMLAVLYIDVDHFKMVNDTLGHAAGDAVLAEFGHRITACTRATDTVARLGGDEFAVVLENLIDRTDGLRIAAGIVAAMHPAFVCGEHAATVSASVGVAFEEGSGETSAEALVVAADQALYDAKRAGRNTFRPAS